ncbi:MAG TPA: response regulator [Pseudolysinimonas sp.]|nr:response regulator [Pseudolysinimonas sp.]
MNLSPLTVLVVDDDFRVASLHVEFVDRVPGFRVIGQAHNGVEALELAESMHPDLVLMDIYLPDIDGLRTLQQMLTHPSPPAAIVISAANDVASVRSALRLGVTDYLVKPFGFGALAERLLAFRQATERLDELPDEATQGDINRFFEQLRPVRRTQSGQEAGHLAPTLRAVYDALARADGGLSASEIAAEIGISRATAQRSLTQLEQSGAIVLDLRYGKTGRPEHRYTVRRR